MTMFWIKKIIRIIITILLIKILNDYTMINTITIIVIAVFLNMLYTYFTNKDYFNNLALTLKNYIEGKI